MNKNYFKFLIFDILLIIFFLIILSLFLIPFTFNIYKNLNKNYPIFLFFVKFAILATYGEIISYRIKNKKFIDKNFGIFPKMLIWGFLGINIYFAFSIFSNGVIFGIIKPIEESFNFKINNIFSSFLISFFMNLFFAPVMMLSHALTDLQIKLNNGKFNISKFYISKLIKEIDWDRMWGFVYKKTIPFFWIPAHTITFLLPSDFRVLFAALLSIFLGILLAFKKN